MTPLASRLRSFADDGGAADLQAVQGLCHLLWAIVTVRCAGRDAADLQPLTPHHIQVSSLVRSVVPVCRGYKTVMRFFPHQVADLEPALAILERLNAEVRRCANCITHSRLARLSIFAKRATCGLWLPSLHGDIAL